MTIRINALPEATNPAASSFLAVDGATTEKATLQKVVDAGAPVASEAEARAGSDNAKRMTALRVKQSIDEEIGNTIASAASGALANTAVQPGALGDAAAKNTGTTAGTVAAGDDERIVGALQPTAIGGTVQGNFAATVKSGQTISDLIDDVASGKLGLIPAGAYVTSPQVIDISSVAAEPMDDQRRPSLLGSGSGNTVIKGNAAGQFALTIQGAPGVAAHSYQEIGSFSLGRTILGANGLKLKNLAFANVHGMQIQSLDIGMDLESVLSTRFESIVLQYNRIGLTGAKGAGFSDINSTSWNSAIWRENVELASKIGPVSAFNVSDGSTEGNGSQGDANCGGHWITATGADGRVGACFSRHYFEAQKGGFDVRIENTSGDLLVHTFRDCNFRRGHPDGGYTTTHVQSVGKNVIIFDGCDFTVINGYARDVSRQIVMGNAETRFIFRACRGLGNVDTVGCINEEDRVKSGEVGGSGAGSEAYRAKLPVNWTAEYAGDVLVVTHNLASSGYTLTGGLLDTQGDAVLQRFTNIGENSFQVVCTNLAGNALVRKPIYFQMHVNIQP